MKKKRLLFIVSKLPFPLNSGFHIRVFNLLKLLSPRFRITLVCFGHLPDEDYKVNALKEFCDEVVVVEGQNLHPIHTKSKLPYISGLIYQLSSFRPHMVRRNLSSEMMKLIRERLGESFDIFWIERISMGSYLHAGLPLDRTILDVDDIETVKYKRRLRYSRWGREKAETLFEYLKTVFYQRKILKKILHIMVCSEHDKNLLAEQTPANIYILPNGIDTEYFYPRNEDIEQNCLLSVGTMDYEPNIDSMEYFLKDVFGKVLDKIPTAKLYIVGKNPPENIKRYHDGKNIIVTGEVEDIRSYYNLANIVVVPIRIAGGTRIKILEALSMGKPVVSTSIGCEGLDLEAEKDLIIADDAEEIARRCVELLANEQRRRVMGVNGRRLVETKYDWRIVGRLLDNALRQCGMEMKPSNMLFNRKIDSILLICPYFVNLDSIIFAAGYFKKLLPEAKISFTANEKSFSQEEMELLTRSFVFNEQILARNKTYPLEYLWSLRKRRFALAVVISTLAQQQVYVERANIVALLSGARLKKVGDIDNVNGDLRLSDAAFNLTVFKGLAPRWILLVFNLFLFFLIMSFLGMLLIKNAIWKKILSGFRQKRDRLHTKSFGATKEKSAILKGEDIICFSTLNWGGGDLRERPHYIMSNLSKDNRVLFVNSPSLLSAPENIYSPLVKKLRPGRIDGNLFIFSPVIAKKEPTPLYSKFNLINKIAIILQIRYILQRLQLTSSVVYMCTPAWGGIEDVIDKAIFCYDCFDRYEAFSRMPPKETQSIVKHLVEKADAVFTSADSLYQECRKINSNTSLIPNAVDAEHFIKRQATQIKRPDIDRIPGPIIGYSGAIESWLDLDLIEYIAFKCPACSVVLIGPIKCNVERLRKLRNVFFLGRREYSTIPYYVEFFDIGIIPFKINKLTLSVNPLKLYEYLCLGKPVVSVDLPEVRSFSKYVRIARSKEEFVSGIMACLREKDDKIVRERIECALKNDWRNRTEAISELMREALERKDVVGRREKM